MILTYILEKKKTKSKNSYSNKFHAF